MSSITIKDANDVDRKVEGAFLGATEFRAASYFGDPSDQSAIAKVTNGIPAVASYALVHRVAPTGLPYHVVAAASTNAANIKASAALLRGLRGFNNAAYPIYVKFHNTASTPTAGSGVVATFGIQAGMPINEVIHGGIAFSTGLSISIVKGIADASTTAVALSDCVLDVAYD